jgi:hypothetical protein
MKPKLILCLALVLSGGLFGCSTNPPVAETRVFDYPSGVTNENVLPGLGKSFSIPFPPNANQVGEWAGFPADFQLQTTANQDEQSQSWFGKPIWGYMYENTKHSLVHFEIAVCQPGTLWGTNHTQLPQMLEQQVAKMQALKNPIGNDQKELQEMIQIITLPNGRKAYFSVLGFGPGGIGFVGFSYERDYDFMVTEICDASDDVAGEEQIKNPISPTNDLPIIFGKVETFLEAQQDVRSKP